MFSIGEATFICQNPRLELILIPMRKKDCCFYVYAKQSVGSHPRPVWRGALLFNGHHAHSVGHKAQALALFPLPSSTHTGGSSAKLLSGPTDYLPQALAHYQRLVWISPASIPVSGLLRRRLTHFLACLQSLSQCSGSGRSGDGDHGKPYRSVTEGEMRRRMVTVSIADVITPI